ncbi:MAG: OadG family transporter subunit, partial [Candidatus Hydrogenedentales bacterium]
MSYEFMTTVSTVAQAIIAVAAIVWLLRLAFGGKNKSSEPAREVLNAATEPAAESAFRMAVPVQDSGALVAAITAAIAASTGTSPGAFRIASISASGESESGFNTPVWGRV